jgi:hypothetical protein
MSANRDLFLKAWRCCAMAHQMCEQLNALGYTTGRERASVSALSAALNKNQKRMLRKSNATPRSQL